jgi:hypothetical protein
MNARDLIFVRIMTLAATMAAIAAPALSHADLQTPSKTKEEQAEVEAFLKGAQDLIQGLVGHYGPADSADAKVLVYIGVNGDVHVTDALFEGVEGRLSLNFASRELQYRLSDESISFRVKGIEDEKIREAEIERLRGLTMNLTIDSVRAGEISLQNASSGLMIHDRGLKRLSDSEYRELLRQLRPEPVAPSPRENDAPRDVVENAL